MKTTHLKKALALLIITVTLNSCAQYGTNGIKGSGNIITENRSTPSYDGVTCTGSMDFKLVKGTEGQITIQGESNLIPYIITEVNNNTLKVKVKDGYSINPSKNHNVIVTIPFEDISAVSLTGSGDLTTEDKITADKLNVSLTGSGDISLALTAITTESSITGSGDLTLKGESDNLNVSVTGSGDFHGYDLNANNTEVSVTGSGDADVVSNKTLKGRVSGSGDISYKGHPEKEDTKVMGSGSISSY